MNGSVTSEHRPSLLTIVDRTTDMVEHRWSADCAPGDCPLLITGSKRATMERAVREYETVRFSLSQTALDRFTDEQGFARVPVRAQTFITTCPTFQRLTDLILPVVDAPDAFSSSFMDQFVRLFCAQIVQTHNARSGAGQPHRGGLASWQKRKAMEILSDRAATRISLSAVAKECGLSVSHFARSFKTTFGVPVHRWVILQRVERAKALLATSNHCLPQIAFDAGFGDQASFNRTFVSVVGTSPGRWRKNNKV